MSTPFDQLLECLPDYLESHGIDPNKKFACPDPDHDDDTPSAHVYKNKFVKCFGCQKTMTIFDLASIKEGLPEKGTPNYFRGNIAELAKRFGVILPNYAESEILSVHSHVVDYIVNKYIKPRAEKDGITITQWLANWQYPEFEAVQESVYSVLPSPPFEELFQSLLDAGFSKLYLQLAGINRQIFTEEGKVIYPLWLSHSVCVGFMARNPDSIGSSHINTANNDVFTKGKYCYGLHLAKDRTQPIYVSEGIKDCLAWWSKGKYSIAALTSGISDEQVELLINSRFTKIVLAYDGDKAGRKGTIESTKKLLRKGVVPKVCLLPDGHDPYSLLYESDLSIPSSTDAIAYLVEHILNDNNSDVVETGNQLIDIVADVESALKRNAIAISMSECLNVPKDVFLEDVKREVDRRDNAKNSMVKNLFDRATEKASNDPERYEQYMLEAVNHAQAYRKKGTQYNNNFLIELIGNVEDGAADNSKHDVMFRDKGLGVISKYLHQDGTGWTKATLFTVGGDPHTGKTALTLQAMAEFLLFADDTMCLHLSTDDSTSLLLPRLIASVIFDPNFMIAHALKSSKDLQGAIKYMRKRALDLMAQWASQERLIMKDQNFSRRLHDFANLIKYYRDKYPNRRILVVNDNMHRDADYPDKDDNSRIELLSGDAKDLSVTEDLSFWATVEYRKNKNDPKNGPTSADIAGGRAIQYHANVIMHLHNDYIHNNCNLDRCVYVHEHNGELLPRVNITIAKNKVSGNTGVIPMDLFPKHSYFQYVDPEVVHEQVMERKQILGIS